MRTIIIAFCFIWIFSASGMIHMSLISKNTREQELQLTLKNAVTDTLEVLFIHKTYKIHNVEELMADFCTSLMLSLNAGGDITVNLIGVDYENGLIYMEVKSEFRFPNGRKKEISCRKLVILEDII